MRLVLDTNTVLSGLLWHGHPGRLIDDARNGSILLATSIPLLTELNGVLARAKFARELTRRSVTVDDLFHGYAALAERIVPIAILPTVLRDPPDDRVLECALGASADLIVSGDDDLLSLGSFRGIPIVVAVEALQRIASEKTGPA